MDRQDGEATEDIDVRCHGELAEAGFNDLAAHTSLEDCDGAPHDYCARLVEKRLSCDELNTVIEKLERLMNTPLGLPEDNPEVFNCRLLKKLSSEDAERRIDVTLDRMEAWLKGARERLKKHVRSHRLTDDYEDPERRQKKEATCKKRGDSGIASQELPANISINEEEKDNFNEIESLKEHKLQPELTDELSASRSDDEASSGECNGCFSSYKECRCKKLTAEEVRPQRVLKQGSKRLAIVSVSQLPRDTTQKDEKLRSKDERPKEPTENDENLGPQRGQQNPQEPTQKDENLGPQDTNPKDKNLHLK